MAIDDATWLVGWMALNGIVATFGLVFNAVAILSILSDSVLRSQSSNLLICNLALADFLFTAIHSPLFLRAAAQGIRDSTTCYIDGTTETFCCIASISTLFAIAVERYMVVVRSTTARPRHISGRSLVVVVALIWSLSIVMTVLPLMGVNEYGPQSDGTTCTTLWWLRASAADIFYSVLGLSFGAGTLSRTALFYFLIWRAVQQHRARVGPAIANQAADSEMRVARTMGLILAFFFLAWSPYLTVVLYETLTGQPTDQTWHEIAGSLAALNSTLNAVVYTFLNRNVGKAVAKFLRTRVLCWCHKPEEQQLFSRTRVTVAPSLEARKADTVTAPQGNAAAAALQTSAP